MGRARVPAGPDPFSGAGRSRLRHIARELDDVVTDAQSRDWAADRPDRVVFARLGQVRHHVRSAARRPGTSRASAEPVALRPADQAAIRPAEPVALRSADQAAMLLGTVAGCLVTGIALVVGGPAVTRPLPLAVAAVAGLWAALIAVAVLRRLRRRWDRAAIGTRPAPIDDPYRYVALRRRIEACATTARRHRSHRRRTAVVDLEYALDRLSAAQSELPRR